MAFTRPFTLKGVDEVLPAGAYIVETDEEPLTGISFLAYRRISTLLHLHAMPGSAVVARVLAVDPNELDAALRRDQAPEEMPADTDAGLNCTTESRRE